MGNTTPSSAGDHAAPRSSFVGSPSWAGRLAPLPLQLSVTLALLAAVLFGRQVFMQADGGVIFQFGLSGAILVLTLCLAATLLVRARTAHGDDDRCSMSHDLNWSQDAANKIDFIDSSNHRLRVAPGAAIGQCSSVLFAPDGADLMAKALHKGQNPFRAPLQCADDTPRWFEISYVDQFDAQGNLAGRHCVARDIDKIVELEAKLQACERRYLVLGETASEGICVVQEAVFKFVNQHLQEFMGYSSEEMVGQPFINYIHEEDRQLLRSNHAKRLAGQPVPPRYEFRLLTKSRGVRRLEMSGSLIDWEGRPATLNYINDITLRKELEERVRQMAFFDPLTELPNRRMLEERLTQTLESCRSSMSHGALMFLDLDNFKSLNDNHGHAAGDLLLTQVAKRLKNTVRESDVVARLGGDEFVVMLTPLPEEAADAASLASAIAEEIRVSLAAPHRLTLSANGEDETVVSGCYTASIGLTLFSQNDQGIQAILKRADQQMYRAKAAGRNAVGFGEQALNDDPVQGRRKGARRDEICVTICGARI